MLLGLRHHAVVGRYHQQGEIDAGNARQHVLDETFVARHVDEAHDGARSDILAAAGPSLCGDILVGEPEING